MKKLLLFVLCFIISLSFVACGEKADGEDDRHEHKWGEWTESSLGGDTCESKLYFSTCYECGDIKWKQGVESDHVLSSEFFYDNEKHWRECSRCDKVESNEHQINTVTNECAVCGYIDETEGLYYTLKSDGTYEVTACRGDSEFVVIPSQHDGIAVTSIGAEAFCFCRHISCIVIPDSITSIGEEAFHGCFGLVEIYNLSSLNFTKGSLEYGEVGHYALGIYTTTEEASKIIITPEGYVFYEGEESCYLTSYMGEDKDVVLPDSCNGRDYIINKKAFYIRDEIRSITLPNGVKGIEDDAFGGCFGLIEVYNLSQLDIKKGKMDNGKVGYCALGIYSSADEPSKLHLTSDGYEFYDNGEECYLVGYKGSIKNLVLPESYAGKKYAIGDFAFHFNYDLKSIIISDGVTSIGDYAFDGCYNLSNVTIGNNVASIGESAFWFCNIKSIVIPQSVVSIGRNAFYNCDELTSVTFEKTDGWICSSYRFTVPISFSTLSSYENAARLLVGEYCEYEWKRQ